MPRLTGEDTPRAGGWFTEQRMAWIAETLRIFGFINRGHLVRKFRISVPQASTDLRRYQLQHPGAMVYDLSAKHYTAARAVPPVRRRGARV